MVGLLAKEKWVKVDGETTPIYDKKKKKFYKYIIYHDMTREQHISIYDQVSFRIHISLEV